MKSLSAHLGIILAAASVARSHLAAWHPAMYCSFGPTGQQDLNANNPVNPLWQLPFDQWWFHHVDNCDEFPPPAGTFLELPAGGSFTVEIASNRAKTSLSYNGTYTSEWPDGNNYPEDYNVPTCITSPNMHTQNQTQAAGTAFAISYESDIKNVTPENLAVFSIRYHTPWKRITTYDVPAAMPACPPEGCICAWGWIPDGCGEPNMYHQGFRCNVTGATSTTPIAPPQPPVWCEDDPSKCVQGSKQMLYWNQAEGDNIEVSGQALNGEPKSPAYNAKCGFEDGAQNDIFQGPAQSGAASSAPSSSAAAQTTASTPVTSSVASSSAASTPAPSSATATPTPTEDDDEEEECDDGDEDEDEGDAATSTAAPAQTSSSQPADGQSGQDDGTDDGDDDDDEYCDDDDEPEEPTSSGTTDPQQLSSSGGDSGASYPSGSSDPSPPSTSAPVSSNTNGDDASSPPSTSTSPSASSGGGYPGLCPPRNAKRSLSELTRRKDGMSFVRRVPLSFASPAEVATEKREADDTVSESSKRSEEDGAVARALRHARRFGHGYSHNARGWEARFGNGKRGSGTATW